MTRLIFLAWTVLALILSACSPSPSVSAASSTEVAGTYNCFGMENSAVTDIGSLTLNGDGTATFGSSTIQWSYDQSTKLITFEGDATLQDATYLTDGPSLSVNVKAGATVTHAPEGHFTCVKP